MNHHSMDSGSLPAWYSVAAVLVIVWAVAMWAAVAVLAYAYRREVRPWLFRCSAVVVILGVLGQLGHVQEHIAQAAYWIWHPESKPWMTPLGSGLSQALNTSDMSKPTLGMEILHMTGNYIFLAGIAGIMLITQRALHTKARRWGRMGMWMQGIHGLEHLALTVSVALGANGAIGLSTWFGIMDPGPGLWTYRIWWHFVANVIGSVIFAIALYHLWREREIISKSHASPPAAHSPEPTERTLAGTSA